MSAVKEEKVVKKLLELNEELENYFRNTIIPQLFIDADMILRKFSPPANMHFMLSANDIGKPIESISNVRSSALILFRTSFPFTFGIFRFRLSL